MLNTNVTYRQNKDLIIFYHLFILFYISTQKTCYFELDNLVE